ncbi:hypothetical protein ATCC90586_005941 [Pythium insidiosum]|nr:hypothetical protein ATCC90586_005941 [Pythium insidiosum]
MAAASSSPSTRPPAATTAYGTASLETNGDHLAALSHQRRSAMRWGITALTVGGGVALIALGYARHGDQATAATTASAPRAVAAPAEGAPVACWQSSYLDGKTEMMAAVSGLKWSKRPAGSAAAARGSVTVDTAKTFQEIFGFGGAFTEAAALQFQRLPPAKQEELLTLYFDKERGSAYEFGRVPMGSCDFSVSSYSFDDVVNDTELHHFDSAVEHDQRVLIPFIQRALKRNPQLKLFLAPWSPPAWMKRSDPTEKYIPSMLGSATPNGLDTSFRAAWALYFSKFISAYKQHNVSFWGLTPQNEPEFAAPWEACAYNAEFQAEFVGNFLGPIMRRDHPEVKIMVFDHNRGSIWHWAKTIFEHPTARQYVDGIAFHWYDNERYMDGVEFHERLNDTHYVDESRFILATESCNCPGVATGDDAWFRAQRYAHDIITDLNNWVVGWVDWNLLLDHTGGPNHLGNNCDAPIIVHASGQDFTIQPMYYFIQHFSKFVPPGSRRLHTEVAARYARPGDAQLFPRYPVALTNCDRSSRQRIRVTDDRKLQVNGTEYCIDLVRPEWVGHQVELVKCIYTPQQWTFVNGQIRLRDHCLQLNHGSTATGVRVTTGTCIDDRDAPHQRWHFKDGEMRSMAVDGKCVTAGYAFLQSVAFVTPTNQKVAVVLNENTEDADVELRDGDMVLETTIPRGAIRTFVWD